MGVRVPCYGTPKSDASTEFDMGRYSFMVYFSLLLSLHIFCFLSSVFLFLLLLLVVVYRYNIGHWAIIIRSVERLAQLQGRCRGDRRITVVKFTIFFFMVATRNTISFHLLRNLAVIVFFTDMFHFVAYYREFILTTPTTFRYTCTSCVSGSLAWGALASCGTCMGYPSGFGYNQGIALRLLRGSFVWFIYPYHFRKGCYTYRRVLLLAYL